ncbi:two-component system OmpR family response regulator [Rhodanobacter sp. ANJX3]|jgi:two-component system OmpR family response regulator|uniref:response regulator n=1 Tax=unclassified Rhodanobacter TaxID=2621553 RepID=UPI0015CC93EA|nr:MULTISPECIES: response regulator [unclassified Rhodanobacter]MBB5357677.1 two-component system OmpR family response regulator [Rhodanobacter sp. ANJX3]NYE27683.1 two-component system OmpR family response regulator [Rhodanobacter sp. K2T2]
MDQPSLILVVDDDPELCGLMTGFLREHGYRAEGAGNTTQMYAAIARERPDLVVLDVMMPGEDGLSAARRLAHEQGPPVIMLSALSGDTDRIIGLEMGADDYLAKPCNPRELLARVRAVLRRTHSSEPVVTEDARPYQFDGWRLDVMRRDLRDPTGIFINLSDGEFALLRSFVEHPQRILSRDQLLDLVHGRRAEVFDRAIDTQISRLRRKLNDRSQVELIRTVRNEGYMLVPKVFRL